MSLVKGYVIIQLNINKIFGHFQSKILFLLCGLARRRDRAHQRTSSELHDLGLWAERRGCIFSVCFFFLYRGRPPPLAADATEVEGSHLHLHERDGELVAFPVIPVYALEGRREPFLEVAQLDDGKRGAGLSKGDVYRERTEGSRLRGT